MPGRLGPRPSDWDEPSIRASPTFVKWMALQPGQSLRYACIDFVKGYEDDEERLMRRIMIARRNNLKDHELLKRARAKNNDANEGSYGLDPSSRPTKRQKETTSNTEGEEDATTGEVKVEDLANDQSLVVDRPIKHGARKLHTDVDILNEMDVDAVEATRSYKKWAALPMGTPFVYNQTYVKGEDGHDWLLKKNIWRRMRYRRRNRDRVDELTRVEGGGRSKRNEIRAQTGRSGVGGNVWITQDTNTTTTAIAASTTGASAAMNARIPRKKVKVDTRRKLKVNNGMDEDESALVSKAVRDAAAVAQQLELGLAVGLDAVAVAALDDPMVVSALDSAAQLCGSVGGSTNIWSKCECMIIKNGKIEVNYFGGCNELIHTALMCKKQVEYVTK